MRYYFIDKEIYFQNKKMPDRKVELFDCQKVTDYINNQEFIEGYDIDGNLYKINKDELIIEEE